MGRASGAPRPGLVAAYGGTFDPVHEGHLAVMRAVLDAQGSLRARRLLVLPAREPPLRDAPGMDAKRRAELCALAIADVPGAELDLREMRRPGPSYTADTLAELRAELGEEVPLALVLSADAFWGLERWKDWRRLPQLAHLVVAARAPHTKAEVRRRIEQLGGAPPRPRTWLHGHPAGGMAVLQMPAHPASATQIRERLQTLGKSPGREALRDVAHLPAALAASLGASNPYAGGGAAEEAGGTAAEAGEAGKAAEAGGAGKAGEAKGAEKSGDATEEQGAGQQDAAAAKRLLDGVLEALDDLRLEKVQVYPAQGVADYTDWLVVGRPRSRRHQEACAEALVALAKRHGVARVAEGPPIEGLGSDWTVLDLSWVVVHLQQPDAYDLYDLDGLWGKGENAVPSGGQVARK